MFTQFVEFGSLYANEQQSDFENLHNAIIQRNSWLQTYWADLNWQTKTAINVTGSPPNPVEIDAGIVGDCINTVRVFQKTGSLFVEIPSKVTQPASPCNVVFNAGTGAYEIYWNSTTTIPLKQIGGGVLYPCSKTIEQVPQNICNNLGSSLTKNGVLLQCSAVAETNIYNYSINYTSPVFSFIGNIA
jgi:hypothetical protein